ncbi:IS630 family transposase [Acaryochloris marina]|uniref:IS630 family transposase n=1 Tax=Acaryochloris marina TaxID=155978 RepID=UPI0037BEF531
MQTALYPINTQKIEAKLRQAYGSQNLRLVKRISALLQLGQGGSVAQVAETLALGEQTIRDYLHAFLKRGIASFRYKASQGRRSKLTPRQRQQLKSWIKAGPLKAGYECGCWSALMVQDLIAKRFNVSYHPHYVSTLLRNLGFSFQRARFVAAHLNEAKRQEWMTHKWPEILRLSAAKDALILFGDEASFAQWGSLSYTWSLRGDQPTLPTSGKRKAYKVFGLIDYHSGQFFYQGQTGRFNSEGYTAFLTQVLQQTHKHIILIQDGARYHTSKATKQFFDQQSARLTPFQLPTYSPDFNPIEFLWKKLKKRSTHLRFFKQFDDLVQQVDEGLLYFSQTPNEITVLMGKYCKTLGTQAA